MEITLNLKYAILYSDFNIKENINITLDVEKGIISSIGSSTRGFTEKPLSFNGIAIPGPINSHVHTADFVFAGSGLKHSISGLVKPKVGLKHKLLNSLTEAETIYSITLALKYMLSTGIAIAADFREGGLKGVKLARKALEKIRFKLIILGRAKEQYDLELLMQIADGIGLSSPLDYSAEHLYRMYIIAKRENKTVSTHVSETEKDHSLGDFEYALKYLKPDFIIHGTHLTDEELRILAEKKIPLVICPRANTYFGVGIPNIAKALHNNVTLALGTDNTGWIIPNIWRELEYTFNLIRFFDRSLADPKTLLKMTTVNASRTLKLDSYGILEEGAKAYVTIIKCSPHIVNSKNLLASLILRTDREDIAEVFLDSKPLLHSIKH